MAIKAVVDVISTFVDNSVSPPVVTPGISLWVPGFERINDLLPGGAFEATDLGAAGANAGILAAVRALIEAEPYLVTFEVGDSVHLTRGVLGSL